ncbi:imidazole glycerol phosphate synthase subunit HisH [soil metagenome]
MRVAILKYNSGNTASVANALRRLGIAAEITDNDAELRTADKVIFPGVGEASTAMAYLRNRGLDDTIRSLRQPVLGICLGMQLLCESSEENSTDCLGIVPLRVRRFPQMGLKVPHVGWNMVRGFRSVLFGGVSNNDFMYFVHGYYVEIGEMCTARSEYGVSFCSALEFNNFYAVQFHPEKSGEIGERILQNFINL